jgi:hypothetical protein
LAEHRVWERNRGKSAGKPDGFEEFLEFDDHFADRIKRLPEGSFFLE